AAVRALAAPDRAAPRFFTVRTRWKGALPLGVSRRLAGAVADGLVVRPARLRRARRLARVDVPLRRRVLDHLHLAVLRRGLPVLRLVGHAPPPPRICARYRPPVAVWSPHGERAHGRRGRGRGTQRPGRRPAARTRRAVGARARAARRGGGRCAPRAAVPEGAAAGDLDGRLSARPDAARATAQAA